MGLDSYIFKTTKQDAFMKIKEIIDAKDKGMENSFHIDGIGDVCFLLGENINYMDELKPDIYWRKYNHITAWFSEKIFGNPKGIIKTKMGILQKDVLIKLRNDCQDVLDHCNASSKKNITINKKYCKKIFPCLDMAFSGDADYNMDFINELKDAKKDIDRLLLVSNEPNVAFIFYADF